MRWRLFAEIGWGKIVLLWGFSLVVGLSNRIGAKTTLPLYLLEMLNDQYYVIFAVLPVILFLCASAMEDDAEIVILRYGSYGRYFAAKLRALVLLCSVAWLGQMAVLLLSGWGLSPVGSWSADSWSNLSNEIFSLLAHFFPNPYVALICAALYLLAGYWLIGLLTLWLGHFLARSAAVKVFAGLYVLTVLWFKIPALKEPPFSFFTFLNHWVLLLHNLTEPWRFPLTIIVTSFLAAGMFWSVYRRWRKVTVHAPKPPKGLASYYQRVLFSRGNVTLLAGSIVLLAVWALMSGGPVTNGSEWVVRLLAGHGTGYFYMMGFLSLLVAQLLPLWPVGGLFAQVINGRGAFQIIRLRRRKELLSALFQTLLFWLLLLGILLLCAEIIPPLLVDTAFDMKLAVVGMALRILDIGFQILLLLLIVCYTGRTTVGFICVLALHFLCVLPIPWLPVGISSLLRIRLPETGGGIPMYLVAVELAAGGTVLLVWLYQRGIQRLFEKNGGLL